MIAMICTYQSNYLLLSKFQKYFLLLLLLTTGFINGQTLPKDKNHVVILIDRSAGMQPENGEKHWDDIFEHLESICFDSINGNRPLLIPNHDYLSIVSFGTNSQDNLNNYITKGNFGFTYYNNYSRSIIEDFKSNIQEIGLRETSGGFFCYRYSFPTIAKFSAIKFLGEKYEGKKFNNTFLIEITDKEQNKSPENKYELENVKDENQNMLSQANEVREIFEEHYKDVKKKNYNEAFKRNKSYKKEKGDNYYIDVFSLEPKKQIIYDKIITQSPIVKLTRFPDKYSGELTINHQSNEDFKTKRLDIVYSIDDKVFKKDSTTFSSEKNEHISKIDIPIESYESHVKVDLNLTTQYVNDFYPGTKVSGYENENLKKQIKVTFEPTAKVLWCIPLGNSLFNFLGYLGVETQSTAVILTNILIFIIFLTVMWLFITYLSKLPYKPTAEQFSIKKMD